MSAPRMQPVSRPFGVPILADCELTAPQFARISSLLYTHAGIRMREGKEGLVRARLVKRLRKLGYSDFGEYLEFVESDSSRAEFLEMVDALTTNKTNFFREPSHFDFLRKEVFPLVKGSLRIWSAGCSTGEEPYTLAMLLNDTIPSVAQRDIRILATDISQRVVAAAKSGVYLEEAMSGVPDELLAKYWVRRTAPDTRVTYDAVPALRRLVHFARLNLMEHWPMHGPFDIIMCRNVMIYFDKETQQRLVERFWAMLRPGGHLFVGHSESLTGLTHRFRYVQPAVYAK